jgi:hypothetical protein
MCERLTCLFPFQNINLIVMLEHHKCEGILCFRHGACKSCALLSLLLGIPCQLHDAY